MHLQKLHGLGNDFLVALLSSEAAAPTSDDARRLCDRHTGVGADGLISSRRTSDGSISFHLFNADGSEAEMSGNGIRCLGLAARRSGWWPGDVSRLMVMTSVGARPLDWESGTTAAATMRVEMGEVVIVERTQHGVVATAGNPHLVVLLATPADVAAVSMAGVALDRNVEWIAAVPAKPDTLVLRVHERGAGETQACGTGSAAAAVVAVSEGIVTGPRVEVRNPGGAVVVDLSGPTPGLIGPAVFVADVAVPTS